MQDNIIELQHIKKCYVDDIEVIKDFNLEIKKGEFVTLLGPSGCGKTTILRMIAGFEAPTGGEILLEGKDITKFKPHQRPINTVFQKYALFPHLNIYENIAFGLKQKKLPKEVIQEKIKKVLEIVDLEVFEKRRVSSLSGGQQQRIAIARAIVNEPEILLLDEPLGALDYKMRQEMQDELKEMHRKLGITFILVTHDQEEALSMSDKIVVMAKGVIQQIGKPEEIYDRPSNTFVADFIGETNIFNGTIADNSAVHFCDREFTCQSEYPVGTLVDAVIRPEDIVITDPKDGQMEGEVISSVFRGKFYENGILSGKNEIYQQGSKELKIGEKVGIRIEPEAIHIMPLDLNKNHFQGTLDEHFMLHLSEESIPVDIEKLFPEYTQKDGRLYDKDGERVHVSGKKVEISFRSEDAQLSDDIEEGQFQGHIALIVYKGDHYYYLVRSRNREEYYVDDEYLWNLGDYVSVVVKPEDMKYRLLDGEV